MHLVTRTELTLCAFDSIKLAPSKVGRQWCVREFCFGTVLIPWIITNVLTSFFQDPLPRVCWNDHRKDHKNIRGYTKPGKLFGMGSKRSSKEEIQTFNRWVLIWSLEGCHQSFRRRLVATKDYLHTFEAQVLFLTRSLRRWVEETDPLNRIGLEWANPLLWSALKSPFHYYGILFLFYLPLTWLNRRNMRHINSGKLRSADSSGSPRKESHFYGK